MKEVYKGKTIKIKRDYDNGYINVVSVTNDFGAIPFEITRSPTANCQISALGNIEVLFSCMIYIDDVDLACLFQEFYNIAHKPLIMIDIHPDFISVEKYNLSVLLKRVNIHSEHTLSIYHQTQFESTNGNDRCFIWLKYE